MLPHSLRLAFRHFSRKRIYSFIIVSSLTVGFACTCLLVSFLIGEGNVDSFHPRKDRTFVVTTNDPFNDDKSGRTAYTVRYTRDHFITNYPEVENICQLADVDNSELEINGNLSPLKLIAVDTSFFTFFDFPLVAGSTKAISGDGIIISQEKAKQIFGTNDVLGKLVTMRTTDTTKVVSITGVLGAAKEKSHLTFDAIMGRRFFDEGKVKQNRPGGITYVLVREDANAIDLTHKINADSLRPSLMGIGQMEFFLDPLTTAYFNTYIKAVYVQTRSEIFIWIGWVVCGLILFMATFNFVNLFLLSIQERKKETGIQKTLGISLWQTIRGVSVEAGIYIGLSLTLSLMIAYSLVPVFNNTLNTDLEFNYLSRLRVLGVIGSLVLFIALVVVVVSTTQQRRTLPISMMRNVSAKVRFSKLFFTIQFFVSITLSVCSITIIKQMKFLENEPLGFNRNIMQLNAPRKQSVDRLTDLKTRLLQITGVENVAQSAGNPISGNMMVYYELEDKTVYTPYIFSGDEDLVKTLDLKPVEGTLEFKMTGDKFVNETLVKKFNMKDPIGMNVPGEKTGQIVGVVKDFTCSSFKQEIPPVIISYKEDAKNLLIDYGRSDIAVLLPKIRAAWKEIFNDDYFDYRIIQQDLMKKYSEETLFYKIVLSASITAMAISCFGLFALSWAVIRSRAKEMGIRKVLGASVANILGLLTMSFAKRLLLAFVLAAPMGYYLMDLWLSRFVYKAPIDTWVFVITGIALATIAVVTLGIQTLKASISSPLEEIRE